MNNFKRLTPFKRCILQNFPFIEEDFDALTNYALLCKVVEYLNKVINAQNEVTEQTEVLTQSFNNLKDYIDNYFKNLDVQDEIDNKIDEMVESGQFDEIIAQYLDILKGSYIIKDITLETGIIDDTEYFIVKVPHLDTENNPIVLQHGFANDVDTAQATANDTAREFALRNYATFATNASIFGVDESKANYNHAIGTIIKNSQLISSYNTEGYTPETQSRMRLLGVKADGSIGSYPINTSFESLIADGVVNTFAGYGAVMEGGVISTPFADEVNIWNFICQNTETKDLMFICCNGRGIQGQSGLTPTQLLTIANTEGYDYAFQIDGGGSTCFVKNGLMVNQITDQAGTVVRKTPDYIYFGKTPQSNIDYNIADVRKSASDSALEAKINENKLTYLESIENNYLDFQFPNHYRSQSSASGVHLRSFNNGELKNQIIFGQSANPNRLSYYDNVADVTSWSIDGDTKEIKLGSSILGTFFKTAENNSNIDSLVDSGMWRIPGNAEGLPTSGIGYILISLKGVTGGTQQIIVPQSNDSTTATWYTRHYNASAGTWEQWRVLLKPTAIA